MFKRMASVVLVVCIIVVSLTIYFLQDNHKYNITPIDSFEQAYETIKKCDKNTLITFDLDDTLITTHDPLFPRGVNYPWLFRLKLVFKYPELLKKERWEYIASIMFDEADYFIIEPEIAQIIHKLQNQGCKIIALTSMETGSFGIIPNFEDWRFKILKELGIDFSKSFNANVRLNNLPQYRRNYPRFYKGILCANQQNKGKVLQAFLEQINFTPDHIISFDDDKKALQSINRMCAQKNIPFMGFEYKGASKFTIQWDPNKALERLNQIMQIAYY